MILAVSGWHETRTFRVLEISTNQRLYPCRWQKQQGKGCDPWRATEITDNGVVVGRKKETRRCGGTKSGPADPPNLIAKVPPRLKVLPFRRVALLPTFSTRLGACPLPVTTLLSLNFSPCDVHPFFKSGCAALHELDD